LLFFTRSIKFCYKSQVRNDEVHDEDIGNDLTLVFCCEINNNELWIQ